MKRLARICALISAVILLTPALSQAGFLTGLVKSIYRLQGVKYPEDFAKQISKTPKDMRADFLLINNQTALQTDRYMLWLDKELPDYVQPSFANEICKKYTGNSMVSPSKTNPITGKPMAFKAVSNVTSIVTAWECKDQQGKTAFTMDESYKASQHFYSYGGNKDYGDVLVTLYPPYVTKAPENTAFAQKWGNMDILSFAAKSRGFFDISDNTRIDDQTLQKGVSIALVPGAGDHMTTLGAWSGFLGIDVPTFCAVKGGKFYEASSNALTPWPVALYHFMPKGYPPIANTYLVCKGGSEPFIVKIGRAYSNPTAKLTTYFSTVIPDQIAALQPEGTEKPAAAIATSTTPPAPAGPSEQFALQVAQQKTNLVNINGNTQLTGVYNGKDSTGCDLVTVEKTWDYTAPKPTTNTVNYRVCNGQIAQLSDTRPESLPQGIDRLITLVAGAAQRLGSAQMNYQGYLVQGTALRSENQCAVKVKIFKGMNLLSTKDVNGCQQSSLMVR